MNVDNLLFAAIGLGAAVCIAHVRAAISDRLHERAKQRRRNVASRRALALLNDTSPP
jgi:hypothetical protein